MKHRALYCCYSSRFLLISGIDPLDLMILAAENSRLKQDLAKVSLDLVDSKRQVKTPISDTGKRREADQQPPFCLSDIIDENNLIQYYTDFLRSHFLPSLSYLCLMITIVHLSTLQKDTRNKFLNLISNTSCFSQCAS